MTLGFIILRHVNSPRTDLYWKDCYTCIRKFYDNPIMIVDDNSNRQYLNENIDLKNTITVFDHDHKGSAEILPYYYFLKLKPFDTAVIIQDSVFLQTNIDFSLASHENIRFLWSFTHRFDDELLDHIQNILSCFEYSSELLDLFHQKHLWEGCFGVMSVIKWDYLKEISEKYKLFDNIFKVIKGRGSRNALERVIGLLVYLHSEKNINIMFNRIHDFIPWDTTYEEYKEKKYDHLQLVKVWSGR